ncbi:MAG TPA: right-handed parallel beta-helix repeat-containing protein, partial [Polyangiaceae bacterium]
FRGGIVEQQGGVTAKNVVIENSVQSGVVVIGGSLSLTHSRISKSVENGGFGFGAFASNSGALTLEGVVLADNPKAGLAANSKATVEVSRSIVKGSGPDGTGKAGAGVAVSEGAIVTIDQSLVAGNMSSGVETYDKGSSVTITSSVVRDTRVDGAKNHGDGIALEDAATLTVTDTTVIDNAESGMIVIGAGTTATAKNTVFVGNGDSPQRGVGVSAGASATLDGVVVARARSYGLLVQDRDSKLDVTGSLVRDVVRTDGAPDNEGTGVQAIYGAALTMTDSAIVNAVQVGLSIGGTGDTGTGSTATLTKVVIAGTHANAGGHFGRAVQCTNDSHTTLTASAILGSQESGFIVGDGASVELHDSIVRKSGTNGPTSFGYGLVIRDDATMLVDNSSIRDNLGVALAYKSGSGVVKNTIVAHNAIGIFADGTTLNDVDQAPTEIAPDSVYVSDTKFVDNQTRVSSGDLPVPEVIH